jgi:hypothetical protein
MHGGGAPQVIRAAQVRLLMASDRLMAQLLLIAEDKSEPTPVRLAAIRDALDRAGLGAKQQIELSAEVTVDTWQHRVEAAVVDWGELRALLPADGTTLDAELVDDEPHDRTRHDSEREDPHRTQRVAEVVAEVNRPKADPTADDGLPPWVGEETGSKHAERLARAHKRAAMEADKASNGLTPRTTRRR